MADYYPILTRAVSGLTHDDAQARRDLYARARTIVAEQLRGRQPQATTRETMREEAALEMAIRRVEAESQSRPTQAPKKPTAAPRQAPADAQQRADDTARSLSKILQAVQPNAASDARPQLARRKSMIGAQASAPTAEPTTPAISGKKASNPPMELGGAPNSLGTLLFATAYIVAALAFTGVTYIRCMVWLYQGVIGYPILLAAMTVTLGLFIAPPLIFLRKTSELPSIDALMRYIHSASRRVL
jgi:hypothetical protein